MNTQINITENGTTTLATAGKYCDRNIDVNVEVAGTTVMDADGILDGSFSGEYASDKLTKLKTKAFEGMANITSVSLPNCTVFEGENTFYKASSLTSVYLPSLTTINGAATFNFATSLTSVYLPSLTTITNGAYTFSRIQATEIDLPSLTIVSNFNGVFYGTNKAEKINLPKLSGTVIGNTAFYGASSLAVLILGGSELNPLDNTSAFTSTPIAKGTGYIYVPDALVDSYKSATNWVTFADQIKPISELEE